MQESEFIRFYEAHRSLLERAILSSAHRDRELAKDALQHGITASLRKFRDRMFDSEAQSEFLRYTLACAEHYVEHEWRVGAREPRVSESYDSPIDEDPDRWMMFAHLERSIGELAEVQRRAIQIRYYADEKLTLAEGARLFGKSVATFKRELAEATKVLREKMDVEAMA